MVHTLSAIPQYVKDVTDLLDAKLISVEPWDTDQYQRPFTYLITVQWVSGRPVHALLIVGHNGELPSQVYIAHALIEGHKP